VGCCHAFVFASPRPLLVLICQSIIVLCAGYPVLRNKIDFKRTDKAANKEDLNRIVTATKVKESCTLECLTF